MAKKKIEVWTKSNEIVDKYNTGLSSNKIALLFNVRKQLILQILRKEKINTGRPIKFYKENKTYEELYGEEKAKLMKLKLSKSHKGILKTQEWKEKIRLANLGKKVSKETRKKMSLWQIGERNNQWLGGKSFEPYCPKFNKEFKNLVRLRDNFCCMNCGISEQKHQILLGQRLSIHHIDYDKKNTCLINCIALCNKCNFLANKNRSEWTEYYREKLSKLYNYEYKFLEVMK